MDITRFCRSVTFGDTARAPLPAMRFMSLGNFHQVTYVPNSIYNIDFSCVFVEMLHP